MTPEDLKAMHNAELRVTVPDPVRAQTEPMNAEDVAQMVADIQAGTTGPWVYEYTCIGHTVRQPGAMNRIFGSNRAGAPETDARRIARLPDLEAAYLALAAENATLRAERDEARTWLGAANNEFGSAAWDWPDLWRRISQLKELSNSRWQSLNAAQDDLATLRASEAAAVARVGVLEAALQDIAGEKFYPIGIGIEPTPTREAKMAAKALTPTTDKELKT